METAHFALLVSQLYLATVMSREWAWAMWAFWFGAYLFMAF